MLTTWWRLLFVCVCVKQRSAQEARCHILWPSRHTQGRRHANSRLEGTIWKSARHIDDQLPGQIDGAAEGTDQASARLAPVLLEQKDSFFLCVVGQLNA